MQPCVIYARVSTKEQHDDGYSIPAQLKAIRAFCEREGLSPAAEFVEAESAGKAGRKRFGEMVSFLREHPEVRTVIAHKLDRLYRNFRDQITLEEELGAVARYVVGDMPGTPQGELLRDVQLSVAKFYLGNLAEEVRKGMAEKVAQGGWPHKAPVGYTNDKASRCLVVDPDAAPLVRHAFERYATGLVSLSDLAEELRSMGLKMGSGGKVHVSALHKMLRHPIYCGLVRWKGDIYPGTHEPIVPVELFERVQQAFEPNRRRNNEHRRIFALRDFLYCAECGCKVTAGIHKGYVYYRCTNGKKVCSQRSYTREELLMQQVEEILSRIEIPHDIVEALVEEARILDAKKDDEIAAVRESVRRALEANRMRSSALLDKLLDGLVDEETYRNKAAELARERSSLELKAKELEEVRSPAFERVEHLAKLGAGARLSFAGASLEQQREVLSTVLCNLTVEDGRISSYQWKEPFGVLERDSDGLFIHEWWALEDLNL